MSEKRKHARKITDTLPKSWRLAYLLLRLLLVITVLAVRDLLVHKRHYQLTTTTATSPPLTPTIGNTSG